MGESTCVICAKHRGEGPLRGELIATIDGLWVYHAPDSDGTTALGYVFIETDRHVPYLSDLTPAEAMAVGRIRTIVSRTLRAAISAEFVFSMVVGTGVDHFHEHVFARHPGTSSELPWHRSAEAAPRGGAEQVAELCRVLRGALAEADEPRED